MLIYFILKKKNNNNNWFSFSFKNLTQILMCVSKLVQKQ